MSTEETIKSLAADEHRKNLKILEKHLGPDYFQIGYLHNKISDAMSEAALSGTEAMKVLESLTPGGSEYYNDPKACADFIRDNRDGLHKQIVDLTRKLKAAERVECYLPVPFKDCPDDIPDDWIPQTFGWLKNTTLTVVNPSKS